jgi:hypothetical protein
VRTAVRRPAAEGVKLIALLHAAFRAKLEAAAQSVELWLGFNTKSLALVPLMLSDTETVTEPVFRIWFVLVVDDPIVATPKSVAGTTPSLLQQPEPTVVDSLPNSKEAPVFTPVPLSITECGPPTALSAMVSVAVRVPDARGAKITPMLQDAGGNEADGVMVEPAQLLVTLKSAASGPLIDAPLIVTGFVPVASTVTA